MTTTVPSAPHVAGLGVPAQVPPGAVSPHELLPQFFDTLTAALRERLLAVHGIGPETADSILLYAASHPVFVVDAYTKRILLRHGLVGEKAGYEEIRQLFEGNLPPDAKLYNEYHALLVNVGKNWCRSQKPLCDQCPLGPYLIPNPTPNPAPRDDSPSGDLPEAQR